MNSVRSGSSMFGSFQTPPHNTNNAGITIGSRATQQVNGNFYMRALAIWYRELTANEIKDIYNSGMYLNTLDSVTKHAIKKMLLLSHSTGFIEIEKGC